MSFDQKPKAEEKQPTSLDAGDFRSNGSWDNSAHRNERGARYRFIQSLCRARRASHLSPAHIAAQIQSSPFVDMFGELATWAEESRWDHWPNVPTRTSADDAVKRAGHGSIEPHHWDKGDFIPAEDDRPYSPPDPEKVAAFIASLAGKL